MNGRESVLLDVSPTEIEERKNEATPVYKILRQFTTVCKPKGSKQITEFLKKNNLLQNNQQILAVDDNILSNPTSREKFRNDVIYEILCNAYDKYQDDNNELLFLASTKFEISRLREIIKELKKNDETYIQNINQSRYSDSAIIFVLKYGDLNNAHFVECMKILIEAGVNINKFDSRGNTAIDNVAILYKDYEQHKHNPNVSASLIKVAELFLQDGILKPDSTNKITTEFLKTEMNIDVENYSFTTPDEKTKLFYWIIKDKVNDFLEFKQIKAYKDSDDGHNTLLQQASKKSDKMLNVVKFLLKNDADPNKTTTAQTLTPLELAAFNNNQQVFEEILKHPKTCIDERQYSNFVRWRSQPMKIKLFEALLESKKLDPSFTYEKTGNTPLHYAIMFSHKKAVQNLLSRHSSLTLKNNGNVSALDIIDAEDLKRYFDSCLVLDNYVPYFTDLNYKMNFRFDSLIYQTETCILDKKDSKNISEMKVISKIGKSPNLEHLLTHPFINTFLTLKWFKIKWYFWFVLFFQAIIFLLLATFFYSNENVLSLKWWLCILFVIINIVLKAPIILLFKMGKNKRPKFFALKKAPLHGLLELLLIITLIGSFFQNQFRAFVFVEMAVSFLLTAGYHPRLSTWSLMLQQVFKTFTVLLMFFSLIVVAFSVGFKILFPDDGLFQNFFSAVFRTYIMTTGEFNIEDASEFEASGFAGYLLFLIFAMSMSLVIVNFWTGVAVTDIERIEKNSEINAAKNVTIFMLLIEYLYRRQYFVIFRKYIPSPLLFFKIEGKWTFYKAEKCAVNFYVNKDKQFEEKQGFPKKVDNDCFNKIKKHYHNMTKVSSETKILNKLDELSKMLLEIKASVNTNSKPKEYHKKGKTKW